jgi:hypothetical protein
LLRGDTDGDGPGAQAVRELIAREQDERSPQVSRA